MTVFALKSNLYIFTCVSASTTYSPWYAEVDARITATGTVSPAFEECKKHGRCSDLLQIGADSQSIRLQLPGPTVLAIACIQGIHSIAAFNTIASACNQYPIGTPCRAGYSTQDAG